MDLNTIWFILYMILIAGYAMLDGFDLGVGVLHMFARSDQERDVHVNSIAPVWDGNEVWLVTAGGALFAAFPPVYATVFSGFYFALMLVLLALIMRAVAMEFRHSHHGPRWTRTWDYSLGIGSLLPSILFGVAVGNVLVGVPIARNATWAGNFLGLLNPFSIVIGLLSLAMFLLHGAVYLRMKSEGELYARMGRLIPRFLIAYVVLFIVATAYGTAVAPHLFVKATDPLQIMMVFVVVIAVVGVFVFTRKERTGLALMSSSSAIVATIGAAAVAMFPTMVFSSIDFANSLTIYNASSSPRTLKVMLVLALVGMPIVIGYTVMIYRIFKGKAKSTGGYSITEP